MYAPQVQPQVSRLAVAGLVLAIVGALPLAIDLTGLLQPDQVNNVLASAGGASVCALPGLLVCIAATNKIRASAGTLGGRPLALAGIAIALVVLFLGLATTVTCLARVGHSILR